MSYQPPVQPQPGYTRTVTKAGLPVWVHVLYATLGWIPCFLGWVVWPFHWWFAQRKTVTQTRVG
jgi:hypothetical protein